MLTSTLTTVSSQLHQTARVDRVVFLIVIAIAIVIAMGFMAAFIYYCQTKGAWPALDMPSFSSGGTWKLYCRK